MHLESRKTAKPVCRAAMATRNRLRTQWEKRGTNRGRGESLETLVTMCKPGSKWGSAVGHRGAAQCSVTPWMGGLGRDGGGSCGRDICLPAADSR